MKWKVLCMAIVFPIAFGHAQELGIDEAVRSALSNQPMLKAAEDQSHASNAKVDQAKWDRVGRLDTLALYTPNQKTMQADLLGMVVDLNMQRKYALQATFTQPLWTWGALSNAHSSAKAMAQASRQNVTRTRQQVAFEARKAYLLAAQASEAVGVAEQNVDQQNAFLVAAKARVKSGSAAKLDQLKAELSVSNAESDLSEAKNRSRIAREALVTITLDPRFREAKLSRLTIENTPVPEEEHAVDHARRFRPDLASLRSQSEALNFGVKAARASGLPVVSFRASILQQDDKGSNLFGSESPATPRDIVKDHRTYQVGLVLSWDTTGPFRVRAKAAELSATGRSVRQLTRAYEEQIALEVRSALLNTKEARDRAGVQDNAVVVAEEQARVARLAYKEGLITSVELQGAELALTAARFNRLRAHLDAAIARANMSLTLGE